eukprot:TRINITY_DN27305_c0_g1_i1.p1 TRINITY_DN27305_c0_g1~~TRINITY_DN27305_c0_g1_i1.p1  ORF type:complete len:415 (+),score=23.05 TRINITY_DN27305_c0_g1_i1:80-1324(+)
MASLETAHPRATADLSVWPCAAVDAHVTISRSKRRKLRDRRVAIRHAARHTSALQQDLQSQCGIHLPPLSCNGLTSIHNGPLHDVELSLKSLLPSLQRTLSAVEKLCSSAALSIEPRVLDSDGQQDVQPRAALDPNAKEFVPDSALREREQFEDYFSTPMPSNTDSQVTSAQWEPLPFLCVRDVRSLYAVSKSHARSIAALSGQRLGKFAMEPACRDRTSSDEIGDTAPETHVTALVNVENGWVACEPSRPTSAYFLFAADRRDQVLGSPCDVARQLNDEWTNLPEHRRNMYCERHKRLQEEYARKSVEYKRYGKYRQSAQEDCIDSRVPFGDVPEFTHEQFHSVIDLEVSQFTQKVGRSEGAFSGVATYVKQCFPRDAKHDHHEPVFSRTQVKRVIDIVTERCGHSMRSTHVE